MDIAIPVDWNLWKDRKIVTIREACFLSVGICPMNYKKLAFIQVDKNIKFKDAYTFKKAIDSEIRKRYTSIDENMPILGGNFPLLKKDIIYYIVCALVNNLPGVAANFKSDFFTGRESLVRLSEFGAWAKSMGWDLPPEFPIEQLKTVNENVTNSPDEKATTAGDKDIKPIKSKPEMLRKWMVHVITVEKGLSLSDEMPDGLQSRLIERAREYGYIDGSAVKSAWSALGLQSARKTVKMKKPPKTP